MIATIAEADREWVYNQVENDSEYCICRGGGWALSDRDVWYKCPIHYEGQVHPEMYEYCDTVEECEIISKELEESKKHLFDKMVQDAQDEDIPF